MAISTWDKCHKIDMNSSTVSQLLLLQSRNGLPPQGTHHGPQFLMGSHRGASARCRSVQALLNKLMGLPENKLLTCLIGDIWQESPLPYPRMIIFGILAMVLQGLSKHWCLEGWWWDPSAGHHGPQRSGAWKEKVPSAKAPWNSQTLAPLAHSEPSLTQNETCFAK